MRRLTPMLRTRLRLFCAGAILAVSCAEGLAQASLSGHVLDGSGRPQDGAGVTLRLRDAADLRETKTDARGGFAFRDLPAGRYTVAAERAGSRTSAASVVVLEDHSASVELVLQRAAAMEFSDQPDFAVAGVTDWTAVGGHGSDATLRTSEKLAQQTLALKGADNGSRSQAAADRHRQAAEEAERRGDPVVAVKEFEESARLNPSEQNYLAWGSELLLHRAVWQAAETFRAGAAAHPGSAQLKTAWGSALFAAALYDQASEQFCGASDLTPGDAATYRVLGQAELAAPEPLVCVEQRLERFLTLQPKNAEANYLVAMILKKRDAKANWQRIESLLTAATALDPHNAEAYLQLGILAFEQRRVPEAAGLYRKAIEAEPQLAEAHYRLGVAYQRLGDADKARQELRLHDEIEKAQADVTEEKRRQIKQFVMVAQPSPLPKP